VIDTSAIVAIAFEIRLGDAGGRKLDL